MDLRILEIASHTENNKVLENYTHKSKHKNPLCGDEMEISLIVKDEVVTKSSRNHYFNVQEQNSVFVDNLIQGQESNHIYRIKLDNITNGAAIIIDIM